MKCRLREKRFRPRADIEMTLTMRREESSEGEAKLISMRVIDVSRHGVLGELPANMVSGVNSGDILYDVHLRSGQESQSLGRMLLKRFHATGAVATLAMSVIDQNVNLESISHDLYVDRLDEWSDEFEVESEDFNLIHFMQRNERHVDLFYKFKNFNIFMNGLKKRKIVGPHLARKKSKGFRVVLNHSTGDGCHEFLSMGSNDYFGLASDPRITKSAEDAMKEYGFGSTGSPATTGMTDIHTSLCDYLSMIFRKEASILFNSGFTANIGTIPAITRSGDLIVYDQLCHTSIREGVALSKAESTGFLHNDMESLRKTLQMMRNKQ